MIICEIIVLVLVIGQNKLSFVVRKRVNLRFRKVVASSEGEQFEVSLCRLQLPCKPKKRVFFLNRNFI